MKQSETLRLELRNAWTSKLLRWWHDYNDEYLSGALRPPIIQLGNQSQHLGQWDRARRTLSISAAHIERNPWLSVMETLRHEMAHQYAHEVLKAEDEGSHGEAFRQACEKLRCSPSPRAGETDLERPEGEEDKILRVLKKVLSLASSPNEHEAQAAMQKARGLLVKYNIDLVELDRDRRFETRSLGEVKGRHTSAELWLGSLLNRFFFVEVLWVQSYEARRDRPGTILQVYGTAQNLDMAGYVYDYLTGLLDSFWEAYKKEQGIQANRERQRYFAGVLEGFYRKLQDQEKDLTEHQALVWKGDAKLKAFYRYLNPSVVTRYGGGVMQTEAYRDGVEDGRKVTIHRPVKERGDGFGGYLKG